MQSVTQYETAIKRKHSFKSVTQTLPCLRFQRLIYVFPTPLFVRLSFLFIFLSISHHLIRLHKRNEGEKDKEKKKVKSSHEQHFMRSLRANDKPLCEQYVVFQREKKNLQMFAYQGFTHKNLVSGFRQQNILSYPKKNIKIF